MAPITVNSPWRNLGSVSLAVWQKRIKDAGGLSRVAAKEVWEAANNGTKDSAFMLEMLDRESSYASNFSHIPAYLNDPWNLQIDGEGIQFDSIVDCVRAWKARMYSLTYKDGVYAKTTSIQQMINEYAPKSDGNDPVGYAAALVAGINRNGLESGGTPVPTTPTTYDYSHGVMPKVTQYPVADARKFAGNIDPASHIIRAFVIHSAYGYLESTAEYFAEGNALTDFMVGNMLDGSADDGKVYQFNDPNGKRYSHSSGPVSNPIEDAAKFLEIYGPNPSVINMYTTALERTCTPGGAGAVSEKEHKQRVALIAFWANKYGKYLFDKTGEHRFTADTFPLIPSENNRSFLIYHGEINDDKRLTCPDPQVRATLDRIIADVKVLLTSWQRGVGTPPVDPPIDPPGEYAPIKPIANLVKFTHEINKDKIPAVVSDAGMDYIFVYDRVKAIKDTPRRQTAELNALPIGQTIKKDEEFAVWWLFETADGKKWYLTSYWTRVLVEDTERIKDAA